MGLYDTYLLPRLTTLACSGKPTRRQREKVVPLADGTVLEIGFGTGLNLPFYDPARVEKLYALEPSLASRKLAGERLAVSPLAVELIDLPGEQIPLNDASVNTVLVTYTLCTIPDTGAALAGMRRVLKPGGRLIFCEHGLSPEPDTARWQNRLNPVWRRFAGGCHLNRRIDQMITDAGFVPEHLETGYIPGPKVACYNYWGTARAAQG